VPRSRAVFGAETYKFWTTDTEIPREFWNVKLEKDGKD
jgi:hypothetical protein